MSSRTFTWNGYESELTGPLPSGATSVQIDSVIGLEAPGYLVIDPDVTNPSVREWIRFNTINGNTLENLVRGLPGSVGPANVGSDHLSGAKIRAVFTKQNLDDLFDDIEENTSDLSGAGGHIPDSGDPHAAAGYIKQTSADARYILSAGDTMQGILSMGLNRITNLDDPTDVADAVTKQYVDGAVFSGDHADLSNVTPDQHHTKYTDAEAVSAMGPVTNGNDLNHERYTDSEAVSAMGTKADANDLNHDRYTDAEAISAARGDFGVRPNADSLGAGADKNVPDSVQTTLDIWTGTQHDPDGLMTADRFTCPETGFYILNTEVAFESNTTGQRAVSFLVGGVGRATNDSTATSGQDFLSTSYGVYLTAGTVIQVRAFQTSGGNLLVDNSACTFSVVKVSD